MERQAKSADPPRSYEVVQDEEASEGVGSALESLSPQPACVKQPHRRGLRRPVAGSKQ